MAFCLAGLPAAAAPSAHFVMDARNGAVYASDNADTRLHPASLTKMMTLYVAFEAVSNGELSMDTPIRVSSNAASEIPSKLGLKAGQTIALRYLVRAAAVKSANDAATAIAEGISGSEAAFVERMNQTARALGMTRTKFRNAHGLTEPDHLSTARDMSVLGRHLLFDYPQYYNLFSRLSADAGVSQVSHTNRRFLSNYAGADGIKTGYTSAAGFNLVASAERDGERLIAAVFGATSSADRTGKITRLLDAGFRSAPSVVAMIPPPIPDYSGPVAVAQRPEARLSELERRAQEVAEASGLSFNDMMARRRAAAQALDPTAASTPPAAHGRFASVAIPAPGTGQYRPSAFADPTHDAILAAATATISELRGIAGMPELATRSASGSESAPVVQADQLDRATINPSARRTQTRLVAAGNFKPMASPALPDLTAGVQSGASTDNPLLPPRSIFDRISPQFLPSGPLLPHRSAPTITDLPESAPIAASNDASEDERLDTGASLPAKPKLPGAGSPEQTSDDHEARPAPIEIPW